MEHPLFRTRWGTGLTKINHSNVSLVHRDHQEKKGKTRKQDKLQHKLHFF